MNDPENYAKELNNAHESKREALASRAKSPLRPFTSAQKLKPKIDFSLKTNRPLQQGKILLEPSLEEIYQCIDWMPYFNAWEFSGRFPDILNDPIKGIEAKNYGKIHS